MCVYEIFIKKTSMEILCSFYGVSMVFCGVSKGVYMVVLWVFLWGFKRMSMGYPLHSYRVSVVFLRYFYGISLGCP